MIMRHLKSDFLHTMQVRGFLSDCTDIVELDAEMRLGGVPAYIGFDATAPSLHVGSLLQIMMLRWLQTTGHRPIILVGGGTTKVGDPSFRADERPLLHPEQIDENITGIRTAFSRYLRFGGTGNDAVLTNNAIWLDELNYLEFLRETGRHFSVNRMLSFESVKSRLDREQSLSFLEFNYMILQAYDFLELHRRYGCRLQIGGSDQWGNIVNGVDLIRRADGARAFGLTSPLITKSDGMKMGKTADGAVWMNREMLSPYEFWQYWRNVSDADVGRFLLLFTELAPEECNRLGALRDSEANEAKIVLANEVTALAHGVDAALAAAQTSLQVFSGGGSGGALPTFEISPDELAGGGLSVVQALTRCRLAASGKEARRLIAGGGARLNDSRIRNTSQMLSETDLRIPVKLSAGRKRHALIKLSC